MPDLVLLATGFIVLSGLLAMVDAAILSISRAEVEEMILQKKMGASALKSVTRHLTDAVVIIVIITNIINILGPILVGQAAIALYGSKVIGIITAILTFGTIIFSEIIPKSLGAHYAPFISRIAAPIIFVLIWILYPLVWVLSHFAKVFQTGKRRIGTEDQIRSLVSLGRRAGFIETDEGQLIHRAFLLNDKTAENIMSPLKDMAIVSIDSTIRQAADQVFKHPYSRYPVCGQSINDVKGLVLSQDILEALSEGKDSKSIETILRKAIIVPARKRSDELLLQFRDRHIHLAVVQEDGKTLGVVTLEDVLEELVGEIEDEYDVE